MTTEQIAEDRNVKTETARSQVKAVLKKTRTNSRVQLIRLALSINLPIHSPVSQQESKTGVGFSFQQGRRNR